MGIEYELKFRADAQAQALLLADHSQYPCELLQMETTYYDTPSGALSSRHYTLRRRMENGVSICTLKTPAAGNSRNELELPCQDIVCAAEHFCQMGAPDDFPALLSEGLLPICGAKFTRHAFCLQLEDSTLELALDSGCLTGGGKTLPLCEVEIELKEGDRLSADLYASVLASRYSLIQEKASKFRRALALYKGESL